MVGRIQFFLFLNATIAIAIFQKKKLFPIVGDMLSKKKPFIDSPSSASQGKDKRMKKMVFPSTVNQGVALPETEIAKI